MQRKGHAFVPLPYLVLMNEITDSRHLSLIVFPFFTLSRLVQDSFLNQHFFLNNILPVQKLQLFETVISSDAMFVQNIYFLFFFLYLTKFNSDELDFQEENMSAGSNPCSLINSKHQHIGSITSTPSIDNTPSKSVYYRNGYLSVYKSYIHFILLWKRCTMQMTTEPLHSTLNVCQEI